MIKRILIATICAIAASLSANEADAQTINGKVINEQKDPVDFATVAILAGRDSSVVAGASTDITGTFEIEGEGDLLQISIIGYQTKYMPLSDYQNGSTITLTTDNELLSEAVISAELPKTELKGNAVVTNIAGSVLSHSGNSLDVLKRVPGIISRNGSLEVIGRGIPVFYLNGHKVTDDNELKNLMSEDIRSVEVISNPGAEYGGDIRCVVRIRTIKRNGEGISFSLTNETTQHIYECTDTEPTNSVFDINYRIKGLDLFGKVSYWNTKGYQISDISTETLIKKNNEIISNLQSGSLNYIGDFVEYNYLAGANWQIDDNHSLGFKLDYSDDPKTGNKLSMDCDVFRNGVLYDRISSHNDAIASGKSLNGNIYYDGTFDKLNVNLNIDFLKQSSDSKTGVTESSVTNPSEFASVSNSRSKMGAGKLVASYPLWKGAISVGTEETYVSTDDRYSITVKDIPASSSVIKENTIAGFVEYAAAFGFGQLSAGLRFEHNDFSYTDFIDNSNDIERHTDNWFPSASFATMAGPVALSLSYSGKTVRPSFDVLSAAVMYDNMFTYQTGDPKMKNEQRRTLSLNANYKWLTFSGSYENIRNVITQVAYPYNDEGVAMIQYTNKTEPQNRLTLYLIASPSVGFWYPNLTTGIQKQFFTFTINDPLTESGTRELTLNKPMYVVQFNNAFVFRHNWMVEANYQFLSAFDIIDTSVTEPLQTASLAVSKDFLKDKSLNVRLMWDDIFNSYTQYALCNYGTVIIHQNSNAYTPCISLRVSYRFNSAKSKYKGTGAGSDVKGRIK